MKIVIFTICTTLYLGIFIYLKRFERRFFSRLFLDKLVASTRTDAPALVAPIESVLNASAFVGFVGVVTFFWGPESINRVVEVTEVMLIGALIVLISLAIVQLIIDDVTRPITGRKPSRRDRAERKKLGVVPPFESIA